MTKLSDVALRAIKKRADAATPGPWTAVEGNTVCAMDECQRKAVPIFRSEAPVEYYKRQAITQNLMVRAHNASIDNVQFVAAARIDMPALLDHIFEVQQNLDQLQTECDDLRPERGRMRQALLSIRAKVHAHGSGHLPGTLRIKVRDICDNALLGRDVETAKDEGASAADDVKRVARRLCQGHGIDPDHTVTNPFSGAVFGPQWHQWIKMAESYIKAADFVSNTLAVEG